MILTTILSDPPTPKEKLALRRYLATVYRKNAVKATLKEKGVGCRCGKSEHASLPIKRLEVDHRVGVSLVRDRVLRGEITLDEAVRFLEDESNYYLSVKRCHR